LSLVLFFLAYIMRGGAGIGLSFIAAALVIMPAMELATGGTLTKISNGSIVTADPGIDTSYIVMILILFGILELFTTVWDWLRG
jgi:hypothetical protein